MFEWGDYYKVAQELADREEEEFKRTAIGRAYYSAYRRTAECLSKKGFEPTSAQSSHHVIWNATGMVAEFKQKNLEAKGDRLKRMRTKVDYHKKLSKDIKQLTQASLALSKEIHDACDLIDK